MILLTTSVGCFQNATKCKNDSKNNNHNNNNDCDMQITYWAGDFPTTLVDDLKAAAKKHCKGHRPNRLYLGYHGHRCEVKAFLWLSGGGGVMRRTGEILFAS